jgi:hypothetical protein
LLEIAIRGGKYSIQLLFKGPGLDTDEISFAVLRVQLLE